MAEARAVLDTHHQAQQQLCSSPLFASTLRTLLAAGNFLNWGSRLGAAAGFRLRSLPRLEDTRSVDGRTNLLAWVAARVAAASPPAPLLSSELPAVVAPQLRVPVQEAADVLAVVGAALGDIKKELEACTAGAGNRPLVTVGISCGGSSSAVDAAAAADGSVRLLLRVDNFQAAVGAAVEEVAQGLGAAGTQLRSVREGLAELAVAYGESAATLASEQELWSDVSVFVDKFSAAQAAAARDLAAAAERRRREEARTPAARGSGRGPSQSAPAKIENGKGPSPAASLSAAADGQADSRRFAKQLFPSPHEKSATVAHGTVSAPRELVSRVG